LEFKGAVFNQANPQIPTYFVQIPISGPREILNIQLENIQESSISFPQIKIGTTLNETYSIEHYMTQNRNDNFINIILTPLRKQGSQTIKIESFELNITTSHRTPASSRTQFKSNSILSNPGFIKLAISESGIYKIDHALLREMGINTDQLNPKNIRIFANRGGMMPEPNNAPRIDDLEELAIYVKGEGTNSFNSDDYILFYAEGPEQIDYDLQMKRVSQKTNIYDTRNYVFINVNLGQGKRILTKPELSQGVYSTSHFSDWVHFEQDLINIGHVSPFTTGAGKQWYGDNLRILREKTFSGIFNFSNRDQNAPIHVETSFAGRAQQQSRFHLDINGKTLNSTFMGSTSLGNTDFPYARLGRISDTLIVSGNNIEVRLRYPEIPGIVTEGWLDFITINARRQLIYNNIPLLFRDFKSISQPSTTYIIENSSTALTVWEITDPFEIKKMEYTVNGNLLQFTDVSDTLRQYALFDPNQNHLKPEVIGAISPQNLHAMEENDFIIVYHPALESEAYRLASHRANHNGFRVGLARTDEIFNEFSGGSLDPVAIRDFARMNYERFPSFKYLLLFGDGSFDYRNIYKFEGAQNLVPCWQTDQSLDPIFSFPSDDFYALLDPEEGSSLRGAIDIAVGRVPINNIQQARVIVDKLIHYDESRKSPGDWRIQLSFLADDEDNNKHLNDADEIATFISNTYPVFNIDKIYFDAYPQIITPGGERFPAAKEAINNAVFKGNLVLTYFGHGGTTGLAQERVVEVQDINSWTNYDRLMLMITATCTFGAFDNPFQTSAGELAILNPRGGAIGLLTTTRAVYAHSNKRLTYSVIQNIFEKDNYKSIPIGEVLRRGKNSTSEDTLQSNARKFTLLGDPTTFLPLARYDVKTTTVNGKPIDIAEPDTLKALKKYTIEALITDELGNTLEWFNGLVDIIVFDKETTLKTLGQNSSSIVRDFKVQRNIVFKGKATVQNGKFSYTFIVPKSINYTVGPGKITYYAWQEDLTDASGYTKDILVGSVGDGEDLSKEKPIVQLYMNDYNFAYGGITNENPVLLAKIEAANGINISSASVGHDLAATIDHDDKNSRVLNDFFQSEIDDFTKGEVRFPLYNLEEGLHHIKVVAFDVAHNPGEGIIEFTVVKGGNIKIKNLYNYPNPFNRKTSFQFEHNLAGAAVDLQIQIFSISGQLVKTIEDQILPQGYMVRGLEWNATDQYGQKLANGVYLYKVKLAGTDLNGVRFTHESDFQKMVLLN
jgi:hypothetical protein